MGILFSHWKASLRCLQQKICTELVWMESRAFVRSLYSFLHHPDTCWQHQLCLTLKWPPRAFICWRACLMSVRFRGVCSLSLSLSLPISFSLSLSLSPSRSLQTPTFSSLNVRLLSFQTLLLWNASDPGYNPHSISRRELVIKHQYKGWKEIQWGPT